MKNLLSLDNFSLATLCYCSSFSKKCNFFMPKIVSYNHHFPKEKSCMPSSWFLSKIRGTIWLVQRFSTWIIDQSASSSYKSWHKKTNCWESFEFSSADLFTYKPDKIEISVEHLKKQWRYSYLGPLWLQKKIICILQPDLNLYANYMLNHNIPNSKWDKT